MEEIMPAVGWRVSASNAAPDRAAPAPGLATIDHAPTRICVAAEHAMLGGLDGSCAPASPGHAVLWAFHCGLRGDLIVKPDGSELLAPNGAVQPRTPKRWAKTPASN